MNGARGTALLLMLIFPACASGASGISRNANPLWDVSLAALSATRERPIFSPTRRPLAAPAPASPTRLKEAALPAPAEPDHPLLTLIGTITGRSTDIAIFREQSSEKVIRLKKGQDYGGWLLRAVRGRAADFEKDRRFAVLAFPPRDARQPEAPPFGTAATAMDAQALAAARAARRGR